MMTLNYGDGMNNNWVNIGNGVKAIPLNALPEEAWTHIMGGDADDVEKLSAQVAWLYGVQRKRAAAVANLPFYLMRGKNEVDTQDWPLKVNLTKILKQYSISMDLYGANYLFKQSRGRNVEGLRWLHPSTITPEINAGKGLLAFTRRIGGTKDTYPVKDNKSDVIWSWLADTVEIGAGKPPADVVMAAANILRYMSETMQGFFERGAIDNWVAFHDGIAGTTSSTRDRWREWFQRYLQGGVKNAGTVEIAPSSLKLERLNSSFNDMVLPELDQMQAQAICVAHDTPMMLLKPEQGSDKAMMEQARLMWINESIIPAGEQFAYDLNEQLFYDMGYELVVRGEELNVNQEEEQIRSQAVANLVNAGETLKNAYAILGYDLPEGYEAPEEPEPEPQVMPFPPAGFDTDGEEKSAAWTEEYNALKRWVKKRGIDADISEFNANHLDYLDKLKAYAETNADSDAYDWRNY